MTRYAWLAAVLGLASSSCDSSQRSISPSLAASQAPVVPAPALDAAAIGRAAGTEAKTTPDGAVRLSFPRSEVEVNVDGAPLRPFAGLSSWAAFVKAPGGAMLMGDTVVFEDEAEPAMDAAFSHGLEVSRRARTGTEGRHREDHRRP